MLNKNDRNYFTLPIMSLQKRQGKISITIIVYTLEIQNDLCKLWSQQIFLSKYIVGCMSKINLE